MGLGKEKRELKKVLLEQQAKQAQVVLQLSISKLGLGLELAREVKLEIVSITKALSQFRDLSFPVDVSGGVASFRNKRGSLSRLEFSSKYEDLSAWMKPKLAGLIHHAAPEVRFFPRQDRLECCLFVRSKSYELSRFRKKGAPDPILAFDLVFDEYEGELCVYVHRARGLHLPAPPVKLALGALTYGLGPHVKRIGSAFVFTHLAQKIGRHIFPLAGAKSPDTEATRLHYVALDSDKIHVSFEGSAVFSENVFSAAVREEVKLASKMDDAIFSGKQDEARRAALDALEKAPKHGGISMRLAEMDGAQAHMSEAALQIIEEYIQLPKKRREIGPLNSYLPEKKEKNIFLDLGRTACFTLAGELAMQTGSPHEAIKYWLLAAEHEELFLLSSRAWEKAAMCTDDEFEKEKYLGFSLAEDARSFSARWARMVCRLEQYKPEEALKDAQFLESLSEGNHEKHDICMQIGRLFFDYGFFVFATPLFERALRFAPSEPEAIGSLGKCFIKSSRVARGVKLLNRAIERWENLFPRSVHGEFRLALAQALATSLNDFSSAIAILRDIFDTDDYGFLARLREAEYRHEIGDYAGASLCYSRASLCMYNACKWSFSEKSDYARALVLGAHFEEKVRSDFASALKLVHAALICLPGHAEYIDYAKRLGKRKRSQDVLSRGHEVRLEESESEREAQKRGENELLAHGADLPIKDETASPVLPPVLNNLPEGDALSENRVDAKKGEDVWKKDEVTKDKLLIEWNDDDDGDEDGGLASLRVEKLISELKANPERDDVVDELIFLLQKLDRSMELLALLSARIEDADETRRKLLLPKQIQVLKELAEDAKVKGKEEEAKLYVMMAEDLSSLPA